MQCAIRIYDVVETPIVVLMESSRTVLLSCGFKKKISEVVNFSGRIHIFNLNEGLHIRRRMLISLHLMKVYK